LLDAMSFYRRFEESTGEASGTQWKTGPENKRQRYVLFVAWYNFCRKIEALKNQTPAMASKLTEHAWTIKELIEKATKS
jgi:hypothetical protein